MKKNQGTVHSIIMYQSYVGNEFGIWKFLIKLYWVEIIVAAIIFLMGVLTILISGIYGILNKRSMDIIYLGYAGTLSAVWLDMNSVFRQIMFPNVSVASEIPFYMVMLIPLSVIIYMNEIQKHRFEKLYRFVAIVSFVFTFLQDLRSGKIQEYRFVAFGLFGAFVCSGIQMVMYFNRSEIFHGRYFAIGMLILLMFASVHAIQSVFHMEKDKQAAEIANEAKGRFLAHMSHEIQTPINAVLGMDEMILRESRELPVREYALDIQNAGKSLLALINDILDISKIESGKLEIIPVEYDVSSMIHDTVNMIYQKAVSKELDVEVQVEESLPSRLLGDDVRISQSCWRNSKELRRTVIAILKEPDLE